MSYLRLWLTRSYQPVRLYLPWNSLVHRYGTRDTNHGVINLAYITCICAHPCKDRFNKTPLNGIERHELIHSGKGEGRNEDFLLSPPPPKERSK